MTRGYDGLRHGLATRAAHGALLAVDGHAQIDARRHRQTAMKALQRDFVLGFAAARVNTGIGVGQVQDFARRDENLLF